MAGAVGISFRLFCRIHWYDPGELALARGDQVIAETLYGPAVAVVRTLPRDMTLAPGEAPLPRILRHVTREDADRIRQNEEKARTALETTIARVRHFGLPMKPLAAEYNLDGTHVTILFSADGRVDFRELVRDLAFRLRTRVLLHQIGARDHTQVVGGYGTCGRELCCRTFLTEFAPVSMRMAKDQSLFLNPVKFSGTCGKLMCCLRFEHETYVEARSRLPAVGQRVRTRRGDGTIQAVSVLRDEVTVELDETGALVTLPAAEAVVTSPTPSPADTAADDFEETP